MVNKSQRNNEIESIVQNDTFSPHVTLDFSAGLVRMATAEGPSIPRLTRSEYKDVLRRVIRENWNELSFVGPYFREHSDSKLLEIINDGHDVAVSVDRIFRIDERCLPESAQMSMLSPISSLAWIGFRVRSDETPSLVKLKNLTALDFRFNNLGDEASVHLAELTNLTFLNLSNNDLGAETAFFLAGLKNLKTLLLGNNRIENSGAADLAGLTTLSTLGLENNHLGNNALAHLARLQNLARLNLDNNEIGDIGLQFLADAWQLGTLPNLRELNVDSTHISTIDWSVLNSHDARLILETVVRGRVVPHARVMFVGMGAVGKSSIARRCFSDRFVGRSDPHDETHDIDLIHPEDCTWKPFIQVGSGMQKIDPRIWDFAGQLVTHGIHESFLESDGRTIFVLTLAADRVPDRPHESTNFCEGNRLSYWLQALHYFSGENVPCILAITRCDKLKRENRPIDQLLKGDLHLNGKRIVDLEPELLMKSHGVRVTNIIDGCSAHDTESSIEPLRNAIQAAISNLSAVMERKVPPKFPALMDLVEKRLSGRTVMPRHEFLSWCEEVDVYDTDVQIVLLEILHYMGLVIHFPKTIATDFRSSIPRGIRHGHPTVTLLDNILNPRWFKWCVYEITRESERYSVDRPDGWFRIEQIEYVVSDARERYMACEKNTELPARSQVDEVGIVRDALVYVRLCWHDQTGKRYLFPRGLKAFVPLGSENWPKSDLIWKFLPEANFLRMIVELHESEYVVRQNGEFMHGRNCVVIEYPKGSGTRAALLAFPDDGRIEVRFEPKGKTNNRPKLLQMVLDLMQDRIQGLPTLNDPMSEPATEPDDSPLAIWKRKLDFLQVELAMVSNAAQKFELQEQIREAKLKIQELGG